MAVVYFKNRPPLYMPNDRARLLDESWKNPKVPRYQQVVIGSHSCEIGTISGITVEAPSKEYTDPYETQKPPTPEEQARIDAIRKEINERLQFGSKKQLTRYCIIDGTKLARGVKWYCQGECLLEAKKQGIYDNEEAYLQQHGNQQPHTQANR